MLQRRVLPYLGVVIVMVSSPALAAEKARQLSEQQKIERLIQAVAGLGDGAFVRKGVELDGVSAAEFLRAKRMYKAEEIRSANDFVRVCSTAPDGSAYVVRRSGGAEKIATFFARELEQMG